MAERTRAEELAGRFREVRAATEDLAAPLSAEDQTVQSMPDASPTKWHRAHTTWFFETFLLEPSIAGYRCFHPAFRYLFNSYYEAVGPHHTRARRGLLSRPGVHEVSRYRTHVDQAMLRLLLGHPELDLLDLVELGIHHEQQHQELLLMDIKHVLWSNPLHPAYLEAETGPLRPSAGGVDKISWIEHEGGTAAIGADGQGFTFDNERPRHAVQLAPFAVADRTVTCGEWMEFCDDGGYRRPELWLSDGWDRVQQEGWCAPFYWLHEGGPVGHAAAGEPSGWSVFTVFGERPLDPAESVCHVSYYEADAFARWAGARLPTEAEWEVVASEDRASVRHFRGHEAPEHLGYSAGATGRAAHPGRVSDQPRFLGDVWEWTSSAYSPYPGFRLAPGAVGEYNGKFMVNQYVLRGGCCATPAGHIRTTYRNFFPAAARWAFSGVRLARDL